MWNDGRYNKKESRVKEVLRQTARKKVASSNPLNRIADAQQIAPAILYALSDDASFMTGTEIVVDGGNIAGVRNI